MRMIYLIVSAVLECMVYGKPNPMTMELVCAAIVLKKGFKPEVNNETQINFNHFLISKLLFDHVNRKTQINFNIFLILKLLLEHS